jgi:hypothetical protein
MPKPPPLLKASRQLSNSLLVCLAVLFGGVLLVDWTLSEAFAMPAEAAYWLTKMSLNAAIAVAFLGVVFARRRLDLKVTLAATGLLSLILVFLVLSVIKPRRPALSASANSGQSTYFVKGESFDSQGQPIWTLAHGKQLYTITFDGTCKTQTAFVNCDHPLTVGEGFAETKVSFHGGGHVASIEETKDGKGLTHFYEVLRVDASE